MRGPLHRLGFRRDHRWVQPHTSDYLDDDLRPDERARLEGHVDDCPECRELLRSLHAIVNALGTMRGDEGELMADTVLASVRSRVNETPGDKA